MGTQCETGGAHMKQLIQVVCLAAFLPCTAALAQAPAYTADNRLVLPADYREWIFLTSSLDLNYDQAQSVSQEIACAGGTASAYVCKVTIR